MSFPFLALLGVLPSALFPFFPVLQAQAVDYHIAEICGGQARASQLSARSKLKAGPNFDLAAGLNLDSPEDVSRLLDFIRRDKPLVVCNSSARLFLASKIF